MCLPEPMGYSVTAMKDLFRKSSSKEAGQSAGQLEKASRTEVQDFLKQVAAMPPVSSVPGGDARLVFALDATASRQPAWDRATRLQADMFISTQALGGLQLQLCYFRGLSEFRASDWHTDADTLLQQMSRISCEAGMTQIERLLRHALRQNSSHRLRGVIYIGDAMEENVDVLCQLAGKLGLLNVPLFVFQEGQDPNVRQAFMQMARLSRGAYSQFDSASAGQLRDLLKAVAIYATGGLKALQDFSRTSHASVKLLEQQLK